MKGKKGSGTKRHEIVTGITEPGLRQRGNRPANENGPAQDDGVITPVEESGTTSTHPQSQQEDGVPTLPAQETNPQPAGVPRRERSDSAIVYSWLRDALWHLRMTTKQLEAQLTESKEAKEKLERENKNLLAQKQQTEEQLQGKQRRLEDLESERDAKLVPLRERIEELKTHAADAERDRHNGTAELKQRVADITEEYRKKIEHCQDEISNLEAKLSEYEGERQFTIILELLSDNKLNTLSADERRSLAFLKTTNRKSSLSPGRSYESSAVLSPSDISIDPDDADVSILRDGKRWKRRRTASVDKVTKKCSPPPTKKKRSNDGVATPTDDEEGESPLSPEGEVHIVPPLEKKFKKPPPLKNRRRPSKGHLRSMADEVSLDDEEFVDAVSSPPPTLQPITEDDDGVESDHTPSAPPPMASPHIYPILPADSAEVTPVKSPLVNTPVSSPTMIYKSRSDFNMQRPHTFFTKTKIKLETLSCHVCNKKIKFSQNCLKCRDCRTICHPDCKSKVPLPCIPSVPTPKKKLNSANLASFCPHTIPRVPAIVVHCINEIERRGLTNVGIYRVPGSDKVIKEVRERLLRAKGQPGLDKVDDVNVLCGVLKDFLRHLREPILTFNMHKTFLKAAESESDEEGLASTLEAIAQLPPANKDTLAFLILHLQRVDSYSEANKMPLASLAKVFGPTIVGHATANPEPAVIWKDTQLQPKVMQRLLGISGDYWRQYLSPVDNPDPTTTGGGSSPTPSVQSSPAAMMSPATPELRPVPESPFLGSCHSPKSRVFKTPRPGDRPSMLSRPKRTGNFFAALN